MKKYLYIVLGALMMFSLTACNKDTTDKDKDTSDTTSQTQTELSGTTKELINSVTEATAEAKGICGSDMTWYYQDGVLVIKGTGDMNNYSIDTAPWKDYSIGWIAIDEGVNSIGQFAFYRLQDLSNVTLPSTLTSIGSDAFKLCNNLKEITIPELVKYTNGGAGLLDCQGLETVTFLGDMPEGADNIVWRASKVNYTGDTYDELIADCEKNAHSIEWNKQ